MNEASQHELLSAYLDGELTADEQGQVERLLASDPRARRLLDELRTLSATLQALPQHKLGENITEQVLRMAERRKRSAETELSRPAEPPPSELPPRWRRLLNRRALTWTALTVAVAVVIALNEPRRPQPGKDVAVAPPVNRTSRETGEKPGPAPEMKAVGEFAEKQKQPVEKAVAKGEQRSLLRAEGDKLADAKKKFDRPKTATHYADGKPIVLPDEKEFGRAKAKLDHVAAADPRSGLKGTAAGPADASKLAGKLAVNEGLAAAHDPAGAAPEGGQSLQLARTDARPLVVVVCDVSPEAAEKQTFRQLLADNRIAWADDAQPAKEVLAEKAEENAAETTDRVAENGRGAATSGGAVRLADGLIRAGTAELVEVRATPAQIDATLDRLAALPEQFLSVSIDAGASAESRGRWTRRSGPSGAPESARKSADKLPETRTPPANTAAIRDAAPAADAMADEVRAKQQKQSLGEVVDSEYAANRGIARRITQLDAVDEADLRSRLAPLDRYAAKSEAKKPAEEVVPEMRSHGSSTPSAGGVGGGLREKREPELAPAARPAPADIAQTTPAAPLAAPPAAQEPGKPGSRPEPAKSLGPAGTVAPAVENAPKTNGGMANGVVPGELHQQAGDGSHGGKAGSVPKAEPAPPAIIPAPKPAVPAAAPGSSANLQLGSELPAGERQLEIPARPRPGPAGVSPADSRATEGKAEKADAEQNRTQELGKDFRKDEKPPAPTFDEAEKDAAGDRSGGHKRRGSELRKDRESGEIRDASSPHGEAKQPQPGVDMDDKDAAWRYAYGAKPSNDSQAEPTCRVLFVLRVVPAYAAKAKVDAKAAAAMEAAAPKAEADAVREAPAAKSN